MTVRKQFEEIHMLQCSLIPPESFSFVMPDRDREEWTGLLRDYAEDGSAPDDDWQPASTCRFELRIENCPIRVEVELPRGYPERVAANVYVRGDDLHRNEQEKWQAIVNENLDREGTDFPVHNLLCLHLIPLLHDQLRSLAPSHPVSAIQPSYTASKSDSSGLFHTLFTSHHLISPTKRRNLQKWSAELSLRGFAKVGYPGVIYAEGSRDSIVEFVGRVKAMQWLALKVRFEEKLDATLYGELELGDGVRWIELEKVGEVVQIMRRSGREGFVTEMGLGTRVMSGDSVGRS